MLRRILSFSIASLTLATTLSAAPPAKGGTLQQVVAHIKQQQKATETLQADFRQEKVSGLLTQPEISTGTFVYERPNKVRWTYASPKPVTMLIADGMMTTYYPQLNKAEKLEVTRYQDRIFKYLGATGAIDELAKYFDFTFVENKADKFYTLELKPKTKTVSKRVQHIKIWIDRQTFLTTKFEYIEGDGDITRYEFNNIRLNQPVAAGQFTLNLPATVKVEQMKLN